MQRALSWFVSLLSILPECKCGINEHLCKVFSPCWLTIAKDNIWQALSYMYIYIFRYSMSKFSSMYTSKNIKYKQYIYVCIYTVCILHFQRYTWMSRNWRYMSPFCLPYKSEKYSSIVCVWDKPYANIYAMATGLITGPGYPEYMAALWTRWHHGISQQTHDGR